MYIIKNFEYLKISEFSTVSDALKRLNGLRERALVVVDGLGHLVGVISVGDVTRGLISNNKITMDTSIDVVVNKQPVVINENDIDLSKGEIADFRLIPVVDARKHLIAVALRDELSDELTIGDIPIGKGSAPFVIAEIGNNHNGSLNLAKRLIDLALESGANCAKFQLRDMRNLYGDEVSTDSQNLGSQYTLDLLEKFQLSTGELVDAMQYTRDHGLVPLCTPWDIPSVDFLEEFGVTAYKIASADLTNHGLLSYIAKTGKPMICSTGMSTEEEIKESSSLLRSLGARFIFLHCNSTYPTPFKDVNLRYLDRLEHITGAPVGYSGHERGYNVAIAAAAMGAIVIEKHLTVDRTMEGNDHKVSLLANEFNNMVIGVKEVTEALGVSDARIMTQGEMMNRVTLAKSVYAAKNISKGDVISYSHLKILSPGHGLQPNKINELIGRVCLRDMNVGDVFYPMDLLEEQVTPRKYYFWSNWGVPVRHHDYKRIYESSNPVVLEFHFSYKDLDLCNEDYFDAPIDANLVVHAPELFEQDHTLDLSSENDEYRALSISHMKRTIDAAIRLKSYFKNKSHKIGIVTNVGGFSTNGKLSDDEIQRRTTILEESLKLLNNDKIEIWPQTMPPYPWHFGGQQYHNLFLSSDWIVDFCKRNNMRVCLDISHSILHCNESNESPTEFLEKVLPFTSHLHLADGTGVDGEGLQIGEGDVDFHLLAEKVKELSPNSTWIPEIWQGHEENGRGFWIACERLEKIGF